MSWGFCARSAIASASLAALFAGGCSFDGTGVAAGDDANPQPIDARVDVDVDGPMGMADGAPDAAKIDAGVDAAIDAGDDCDFANSDDGCVVPSNLPADFDYAACVAATEEISAPPLTALDKDVHFVVDKGEPAIKCEGCNGLGNNFVPGQVIDQPDTDVDLAVFCVASIDLPDGVTWDTDPAFDWAIAIVSAGDVDIDGTVTVGGGGASDGIGGAGGPGGFAGAALAPEQKDGLGGAGPCPGSGGVMEVDDNIAIGSGGGGGGFAGAGGPGGAGDSDQDPLGGGGGAVCTNALLTPLFGGSGGGSGGDGSCDGRCGWPGGGGGGAIQIASRTTINVAGEINAGGGTGYGYGNDIGGTLNDVHDRGGGGGGGAGGGILLEAPVVGLAGVSLVVDGGNGGCDGDGHGSGRCAGGEAPEGSPDGDGTPGTGASDGAIAGEAGGRAEGMGDDGGGGGGGGGGTVRINGGTGNPCSHVSPTAACSTGKLSPAP